MRSCIVLDSQEVRHEDIDHCPLVGCCLSCTHCESLDPV